MKISGRRQLQNYRIYRPTTKCIVHIGYTMILIWNIIRYFLFHKTCAKSRAVWLSLYLYDERVNAFVVQVQAMGHSAAPNVFLGFMASLITAAFDFEIFNVTYCLVAVNGSKY